MTRRYEAGQRVRLLQDTDGGERTDAAKIVGVYRIGPGQDYLSLRWPDGATAYLREDGVKEA